MFVAAGTLSLAIVAACVAIREARERRERDSSQARLVTCGSRSRLDWPELQDGFVVTITNHSGYPILRSEILHISAGRTAYVQGARSDAMREQPISPGESWQWVCPPQTYQKLEPHLTRGERPRVTFMFVDATGRWWERIDNGQPRPLDENQAPHQ